MKTNSLLAPQGATHWSPKNGSFYTERDGKFYQWGSSGIAPVLTTHDWIAQLIPVDSAAPAWDGEGLPPVGVECEAHAGDITSMPSGEREFIWSRAKVIAHDEGLVVFRWLGGEMKGQYAFYRDAESFRPIKTPEQLAAEQRERAIVDMCQRVEGSVVKWNVNIDCSAAMRAVVEALYDAGARLPK